MFSVMKKTIALMLTLVVASMSLAQEKDIPTRGFPSIQISSNQQFIDSMATLAVVDVTRSYVVREKATGDSFTREGEDCFNKITSMAIRVKGGLLVTKAAVSPWLYDRDFNEYSEDYDGVAQALSFVMDGKPFVIDNVSPERLTPGSGEIYFIATQEDADGLTISHPSGDIDGWAILFPVEKYYENSTTSLKKKLSIMPRTETYEMTRPRGIEKIKGGLYVEVIYSSIGTLEFRICGVIVEAGENLSIVVLPTDKTTSRMTPSKGLAPIDKDDSKKKSKKGAKK